MSAKSTKKPAPKTKEREIMEFKHVSFEYEAGKRVLEDVCFRFIEGKTYALVGPTGQGKSTTASLMARLFDPIAGTVELYNKDIRSFEFSEITKTIGFILQEPFLFSGTVGENLVYGNPELENFTDEQLLQRLKQNDLQEFLKFFDDGLKTVVSDNTESISLGQKQIVNFMRIILRSPKLLIMDEATANIDTVTEKSLQEIISKLPASTTKVIIAHRLNTIKNADEILFISGGKIRLTEAAEREKLLTTGSL
jgi:ATP-binding cassette subfamily B protein